VTLAPLVSPDLGGARVMVPSHRLDEAKEILDAALSRGDLEIDEAELEAAALAAGLEQEDLADLGSSDYPPCPSCGHTHSHPAPIPAWILLFALAGVILAFYKTFAGLVLIAACLGLWAVRRRLRDCAQCGRRFDPKAR
jgi:hypothetical protein